MDLGAAAPTGAKTGATLQPTGVPNLDRVLGGGLPRGALVLLIGPPGSGKTTLAAQMAFVAAREGGRVLLLTALAEPTSKLIAHLRTFAFFDERLLGDAVQVYSVQQFLARGLAAASAALTTLARGARASLVLLDGFQGVRQADPDPLAAGQFLSDLGAALLLVGATTVVTSEAPPRDAAQFPEAATADVLLGLHYYLDGSRQRRALEAIKVRGAAPLAGLHRLVLTGAGATVYPRLEERVVAEGGDPEPTGPVADDAGAPPAEPARVSSGLVLGSPGTGKTLLAMHLTAASLADGEPVLVLLFREDRADLLRAADAFALGRALRSGLAPGGGLALLRWPPVELDADIVADRLLDALDRTGAQLLVVDGVGELEHALARGGDPERASDYLGALHEALRRRGVTSLFIKETRRLLAEQLDVSADAMAVLAHNVLLLQQVTYRGRLHRILSVLKMRYSAHDLLLREYAIAAPVGFRLLTEAESAPGVLAGIARQQGAAGLDPADDCGRSS